MRGKDWSQLDAEAKQILSFCRLATHYWRTPSGQSEKNLEILTLMAKAKTTFGQWIRQYEEAEKHDDEIMLVMASVQILQRAVKCEQWLWAIKVLKPSSPIWEQAVQMAYQMAIKRHQIGRLNELLPDNHHLKKVVSKKATQANLDCCRGIKSYKRRDVGA